jgi:hypothetical protein
MTVDYRTYIRSDAWRRRRKDAILRSTKDGWPRCEVCGRPGIHHKRLQPGDIFGSSGLQVHHLHYRNLGQEEPEDLIVLCTDELHIDDYYKLPEDEREGWTFVGRGCHSRVHDDPSFKLEVRRIAGERW